MMLRFLLWLALAVPAGAALTGPVDLLLVADDAALQPLVRQLTASESETCAAWRLWRGNLAGKSVVLARSEGDPLNAVAATTLALRRCPPRLVVVFGTARPHDPALHRGDVVVSERFVAFDGLVSPVAAPGEGSQPLHWTRLDHALMTPGEKEVYVESFPADGAAAALALGLPSAGGHPRKGVLGSAGQVNRESDRIAFLHAEWGTSSEDGDSAFVAGCAALLGRPVVGFRVIDGSPADAAAFALSFVEAWK